MAVQAVVGTKLFTLNQLDDAEDKNGDAITELIASTNSKVTVATDGGPALAHADLKLAREAADDTVPFTGIGPGKPLTLYVDTVYVGDYPDTVKWLPGRQPGDVLVTSAHKALQDSASAARAVHMLHPLADRNTYLKFEAVAAGTRLAYYSPAVADMSILFNVELSVDRDIDDKLGDSLKAAMDVAAGLPIFAAAAPYLVAAEGVIPIVKDAIGMLTRPHTFFEETVEINLSRPGLRRTQASAFVVCPDDDPTHFAEYELGGDQTLVDAKGKAYDGPVPYVVLTADGAANDELHGWAAQAASAVIMERFFQPDPDHQALISQALDLTTQGLSLLNDIDYRERATAALQEAATLNGAQKDQKMSLFDAYVKNIHDDGIRNSVQQMAGAGTS